MTLRPGISWGALAGATLALAAFGVPTTAARQQAGYRDPGGRFEFSYPQAFGDALPGTNVGFGNRAAAVRFAMFSAEGIGGEAVLTRGRVSLDVQAAGGLYDEIASEALPLPLRRRVESILPPLTVDNLCEQLGRERHVDVAVPALKALTAAQQDAVARLDAMGNLAPQILRCTVTGDTVLFEKEAAAVPSGARRRTYGAVRFLSGRYSSFQIVRAGGFPDAALLADMQAIVASWRVP